MTGRPPASPVNVDIDLRATGRQFGHIRVPHSSHESAYGWIAIPIAVIGDGRGPSVLLTAGNHGDEYEGQIALLKLMRELEPAQVRGRVVIIPRLNLPAAAAGRRTSPIDDGNLNRLFPGDPQGTPTAQIAHFVDSVLLPMTEASADLHSGGSSLEYLPCTMAMVPESAALKQRLQDAMRAFGAPVTLMFDQVSSNRTLSSAARSRGHLHLATEIGGGATTCPATQAIADQGVRRLLAQLGMITADQQPAPASRLMRVAGPSQYLFAPVRGLFEPLFDLGATVAKGDLAGRIHFPEEPERAPREMAFPDDGVVVCRRVPSLAAPGDCLLHLARDI